MNKTAIVNIEISPIVEGSIKTTKIPHINSGTKHNLCKLVISCGGGMGGSCWDEYVYINLNEMRENKFVEVLDPITSITHFVNTANIVKVTFVHGFILDFKHKNNNFPDNHHVQYYFEELDVDFKFQKDKSALKTGNTTFISKPVATFTDIK